jgi:hypothetical protein
MQENTYSEEDMTNLFKEVGISPDDYPMYTSPEQFAENAMVNQHSYEETKNSGSIEVSPEWFKAILNA